ncbi:MAG: helical backbone metal receptor [Psychroflexus sp.]|nr:helical backbone metal receptor [Psychroflexus sp.]
MQSTPKRIISLVPSLTELVYDLGLSTELVGVTKFCVHPEDMRTRAKIVGGTKQVKHHYIDALDPDLILCSKEENTSEIVAELEKKYNVYVSDINTLDDAYDFFNDLGRLCDCEEKTTALVSEVQSALSRYKNNTADLPQLKIAYFIWRKPWMLVGNETFIQHLLSELGFTNVYADAERYPEVELADLKKADYYFLSTEPFPFEEKHKVELPVNPSKVKIVDGEFFSWYGSRLLKAFPYFLELRTNL